MFIMTCMANKGGKFGGHNNKLRSVKESHWSLVLTTCMDINKVVLVDIMACIVNNGGSYVVY